MTWNASLTCSHVDTCLSSFLLDHHNREGELLLGVFVDGNLTNGGVLRELLIELHTATASIDPADLPGFDYDSAKAAAKSLFADFSPNEMDRGLFDSSLDIDEDADDEIDADEMAQAWFLFRWDYPTPTDENGHCVHCGRDNTGYEDRPCSDECPAYWEDRGIPHPDYP